MLHFWIALIFGLVVIALLLLLYFTVDKRSTKVRTAEREFIYNCGDESLIALYEQATSDKERLDIAEFAKEKIAQIPPEEAAPPGAAAVDGDTREDILGEDVFEEALRSFSEEEQALLDGVDRLNTSPQEQPAAASGAAAAAPPADAMTEAEPAAVAQLRQAIDKADLAQAKIEQELPGLANVFAGSAMHGLAGEAAVLAQANAELLRDTPQPETGINPADELLPQQDATYEGKTRVLPLNEVDWNSVEAELQKKREEEARIMAQNMHIQEVFAKVKDVEARLLREEADDVSQS